MGRRAPLTALEDRSAGGLTAVDARLEALVQDYGRLLRQIIGGLCHRGSGLDPDEIEQDARIRLWRALERETELRDAASYIYKVAATATIDALRRLRARREDQLQIQDEPDLPASDRTARSPEETAADNELLASIQASLRQLSDARRRAVSLHLQGFTSLEIAALLGWTEPRARNLIYRGLRDLRAELRRRGIDYAPDA